MSRVTLLGIPIDAVTSDTALQAILDFLEAKAQHHVMTPNSEMLRESARNPAFRAVLQKGNLNLPDSRGLLWAARRTGQVLPERVTGVDTVMRVCMRLDGRHPVFLLGAAPGVAEKAAVALKRMNPTLRIAGTFAGSPCDADAPEILESIAVAAPHLLLVAFGAPQQDLWIAQHLAELPSVRVAIGVGGTFDFLAGMRRRAPQILQRLGLEWLWRLFREPWRIRRIWNAVVVFPFLIWKHGREAPATFIR